VDSIAGGGGIISLPAYLSSGIASHLALGTNKFSSTIGTLFSTIRYAKARAIIYSVAVPSAIGSVVGSFVGARLVLTLPDRVLRIFILFLIPIASFVILLKRPKEKQPSDVGKPEIVVSFLIGAAIGIYDGFFGPGTGTFLIILYASLLSLDLVKASGTAKLVNLASNVGALFVFILNRRVIYSLGIPAALFGILGNWIGSGFALKKGVGVIKVVVMAVLALLFVRILLSLL